MAILQRPYAGQVKNLTPPAAGCGGWFLAVGGVICCGRWRQVWQGWQAVGAVQVGQGWRWCVVIVGGGLLLAWSSGAALAVLVLPGAGGGRNIRVLCPALPGYFPAFPRGGTTPSACRAADPAGRAGGKARKMGKRKRPGQTARRALLLWPLVCTGGNGSGGVRPGAGGGADLLAVPVGMVSAGTVPAVGVPASRLALAVLHPGRFWTFAGGVRFST